MRKSRSPARRLLSQILGLGALISAVTLALVRPASTQQVAPSWSYTGSLNTARRGPSATLLPNGKVLVVGGFSDAGLLASAELYDPQAGTWSFTGSLNVQRAGYTATLLGNGKVLVAGGYANSCCDQSDLTNTAELYDAATGQWSFTGNLSGLRLGHTATLLSNGKVLFAGGWSGQDLSATNTADLYDPATGKWSLTGNLNGPRIRGHNATLLQDGKVLVTGGCLDDECSFNLGSAELYDPNTETWSLTGSPNFVRDSITLTTLPNGTVLLLKGAEAEPYNTSELYYPATGQWSFTGRPLSPRYAETVTLLPSGQVLVVGGSHVEVLKSAEHYDPAMFKWNTTASLNTARLAHSATLLNNGKVLIGGGSDGNVALRSAELYSTIGSEKVVTVSAASYHLTGLAGEAIAASFGTGLATATIAATTLPLPTEIAGTTVKVKDSAGAERLASLFYVSPTQVNYQIPAGTTMGVATVTITSGDGSVSSGVVLIKPVAPSLFAANGDGQGVAAAIALRVKADGSQSYEEVVEFDAAQNRYLARPLDLGPESDQVYLVVFGTGIRSRSSLSAVIASIGGAYAAVSFAGAQPDFAGLDQVNVLVGRSLMGRGEVDVLLTVEAQMANPVRIQIK